MATFIEVTRKDDSIEKTFLLNLDKVYFIEKSSKNALVYLHDNFDIYIYLTSPSYFVLEELLSLNKKK